MKVVAGIDVGKDFLDVSISAGEVKRFDNTQVGIQSLVSWLGRGGVSVAICESTGGYEREMVKGVQEACLVVQVVHPVRVRAFARACGYEAKTDALDAQVLARYGEVFESNSVHRLDESGQELREVIRRREQLVAQRVQEKNRLARGLRGKARESTERHIEWLDEEIKRLEAERQSLLRNDEKLLKRAQLYRSVTGVLRTHCRSAADRSSRTGQVQREVVDGARGACALGERQWPQESPSGYPRRSRGGAPSSIHGFPLGCAP